MTEFMRPARSPVPLGIALTLPLILILGGGAVLISFLSMQSGQKTADTVVGELANEVAGEVGQRLGALMRLPELLNAVNGNALASGNLSMAETGERDRYFAGQLAAFPEVSYSYYGRPDASFYGARRNEAGGIEVIHNDASTHGSSVYFEIDTAGNPVKPVTTIANFDCRTRPWYKAGALGSGPVFSDVYRHFVYQDLAITAAQPVRDASGRLEGVLGVDFRLDRLNDLLAPMTPVEGATIAVFERQSGLLVANSLGLPNHGGAGADFRRFTAADLEHPTLPGLYARLTSQVPGLVGRFRAELPQGVVHVESMAFQRANVDWLVLVTLPQAALTREVDDNIRTTLALSLLTVILSILLGLAVVRSALRSLDQVVVAADRISRGDWDYPTPGAPFRELDRLARAFESMASQLRGSIQHLEDTVAARTGELARKNQELALANATKDKFFALVGHDLLGPVDSITRLLETLADPGNTLSEADVVAVHTELALSSRHVFHLLDNLLQWAQSQKGEIRFRPDAVDVADLIAEVLELLAPRAAAKSITLTTSATATLAWCDADMVRTVIRNLVSNALKFSHSGGTIHISATLGEAVLVEVRDQGVGMAPEKVAALFQLGKTPRGLGTQGERGSGLGLILCHEFVTRHGGTLEVESEVGRGSTFRFSLPRVADNGPLAITPR